MAKAKDVITYFVGMLFSQVVTFFTGVFVARWLGPESFGVLSLTRNIFAVAIIVAPLGLDLSLLRHLGENRGEWARSIAQIESFRKIAAIINIVFVALLCVVVSPWIERHMYHREHFALYLDLTFLMLPFSADLVIVGAAFRGLERPIVQNITGLYIQPVMRVLLLSCFLSAGFGIVGVLIANTTAAISSFIVMGGAFAWLINKRELSGHKIDDIDRRDMSRVFGYSGWLAAMLLLYNTLKNVDILVLGWFRPASEVGEYAALATIAYTIQIFPQAISQTLGTIVARHYTAGNLKGVRDELSNYLRRAVLLSSPIFAGIAVFGPWLDLIFGAKYHFSSELSFCLALAYLISGTLGWMGVSLTMTGRHRIEFAVLVVGGAITFLACVLTAPRFGSVGVALSVAGGYALINGVRTILSARYMGGLDVSIGHLAPPVICTLIAEGWRLVLDRTAPHTLWVGLAAAPVLLFGFAIAYWLLLLRANEKAMVLSWFRRLGERLRLAQ